MESFGIWKFSALHELTLQRTTSLFATFRFQVSSPPSNGTLVVQVMQVVQTTVVRTTSHHCIRVIARCQGSTKITTAELALQGLGSNIFSQTTIFESTVHNSPPAAINLNSGLRAFLRLITKWLAHQASLMQVQSSYKELSVQAKHGDPFY